MRRPIVGVIGSGQNEHANLAPELGRWLAAKGVHLLTGGGLGVMSSVSRAFYETPHRKGLVIGVLPSRPDDPQRRPWPGYPNPWVELPITTHLPLSGAQGTQPMSRNHINVLTSEALIILPGGEGTLSEVTLALRYQRPIIAYLQKPSDFPGLPAEVPLTHTLAGLDEFLSRHIKLEDH